VKSVQPVRTISNMVSYDL